MFSGWMKGAFRGGKKDMQESIHQNLDFILGTAPMWDRLVTTVHDEPMFKLYCCSSAKFSFSYVRIMILYIRKLS